MRTIVNISNVLIGLLCITMISCEKDPNDGGGSGILPITLDCSYNEDVMLTDHNVTGVDYIVTCDVEVNDGTFSIAPGTVIEFEEGASMIFNDGSILKAEGISGNEITMRGTGSQPSWRGIYIFSSSGRNILNHVNIDGAGDGEVFGQFTDNHAAVTFQGRLSMTNSTITNSGDNGIYSEENLNESTIDEFSNNTIAGCKRYPILISQNLVGGMDLGTCTFSENGKNMVGMHQETADRLTVETVFQNIDIPYYIESGFELYEGLTLEAGVDLVMGNSSYITSIIPENQFLLIQGTQSNHVTIRGEEALSGYWQGIFLSVGNTKNIWEYLDLSDGGSSVQGFNSTPANVTLERQANLTINNCTMARSGSTCDVVLSTFFEEPTLDNNSPEVTAVCIE